MLIFSKIVNRLKKEIITLKSYSKKENVVQLYISWLNETPFHMFFPTFKLLIKYYTSIEQIQLEEYLVITRIT